MNPSSFFDKAADGSKLSLATGQHILRYFSKKPDIIAGQPIQSQTADLRVPESLSSAILILPDVPFSPEAHSISASGHSLQMMFLRIQVTTSSSNFPGCFPEFLIPQSSSLPLASP